MAFLSSAPTAVPPPSSSSSSTTATAGGTSGSGSGKGGGFVASSKFLVLFGALVVLGSSLLLSMQSTHVLNDVYKSLSEMTSESTSQQGSSAHRERLSGGGSSSRNSNANHNHHYIDPKTGKRKDMNIVLFYADDWTWRTLGFVNKVVKTPHLDEMARRGMTFSHNCVTTSICWQSRATKSTGLYVAVHKQQRIWDDNIFDKTVLWRQTLYPQLFLSGYNVGFFGKW
jgi:Sulfatase